MVTYNTEELMNVLHITKKQANALLRSPSFPSTQIGRTYIVEESALKQWLENTRSIKLDYSKV